MNDNLDYPVHRKGQLCNDHVDLTNWVCMFTDKKTKEDKRSLNRKNSKVLVLCYCKHV